MMGWHHSIGGATLAITVSHYSWMSPERLAPLQAHADALPGVFGVLAGAMVHALTLPSISILSALMLCLIASGAALIPDLDHHNSLATGQAGVVGDVASHVLKHRGPSHTVLCLFVLSLVASYAQRWTLPMPWASWLPWVSADARVPVGSMLMFAVIASFALIARKWVKKGARAMLAGCVLAVVSMILVPDALVLVPWAIGIGIAAHIIGDMLTTDGVPPLTWPFVVKPKHGNAIWRPNGHIALPLAGATGSAQEVVVAVVTTAWFAVMVLVTLGVSLPVVSS